MLSSFCDFPSPLGNLLNWCFWACGAGGDTGEGDSPKALGPGASSLSDGEGVNGFYWSCAE